MDPTGNRKNALFMPLHNLPKLEKNMTNYFKHTRYEFMLLKR